MDTKQFEKNKKWINEKLGRKYPGAKMLWDSNGLPSITIQEHQEPDLLEVIEYAKTLVERCGGECEFYPERAY